MDAAQKAAQVAKFGKKFTCYACAVKFYDLNKPEPLCPKCQADQRESPAFEKPKTKRARKKVAKKVTKKKKAEKPPPSMDDDDVMEPVDEIELAAVDGEPVEIEPETD